MSALSEFPVKVHPTVFTNKDIKPCMDHPIARILVLLWRPCHLVNQFYWDDTLILAKEIEKQNPKSIEEFTRVIGSIALSMSTNYLQADIDGFWPEAMPYLLGEKEVPIVLEKYRRGDGTEPLGGYGGCTRQVRGSGLGYIACGDCSPDPLTNETMVYYKVRKIGLSVENGPMSVGVDVLECPICGHQIIR